MANGIKRKVTLGIASEGTFNTAETNPIYVIPAVEMSWNPVVEMAQNQSMLGSAHATSYSMKTTQKQEVNFTMKIDEKVYGAFLKQNYTDTVTTVSGETTVYHHTWAYTSTNNGGSLTLFIQDDDRGDLIMSGFRYESMVVTPEINGFITAQVTGTAKLEASGSVTNSVTTLREFVGRHAGFKIAAYGQTLASANLLTASLNMSSPLVGDDVRFALGSADMVNNSTLATEITQEISMLYPDETYKDFYMAGTAVQTELEITDTARYVTGSVANTSPLIKFTIPHANITGGNWTDSGADELMQQSMTFTANDYPGVSDAPMKIELINAVVGY